MGIKTWTILDSFNVNHEQERGEKYMEVIPGCSDVVFFVIRVTWQR